MRKTQLGGSDLHVGVIGLGCMGMSEFYGTTDEAESIATIHRALDLGVNFFDSSDLYGSGRNEELLRKALAGRRDEAIIATKFGIKRNADDTARSVDGSPEYVREACEASLKRLGIETIDLYYQHRVDTSVPIEETVGAMAELVQQGKVRYLGLSEAAAETIQRAHATHPITALQSEYSIWTRGLEDEILPVLRERGIALVAYSPLGRGFLTGKLTKPEDLEPDDWRHSVPRFQGENLEANLQSVRQLEQIAAAKGCTPAQLALAWVLAKGEDIVPIPGTKRRKYLEENAAAADITLTADEVAAIDALGANVLGTRYHASGMKGVEL